MQQRPGEDAEDDAGPHHDQERHAIHPGPGIMGVMPQLACFFKNPLDVDEPALHAQFALLIEYAERAGRPLKQQSKP